VGGGKVAEQVISLLRDPPAGRPATLWMAGDLVERGTLGAGGASPAHSGSTLGSHGMLV
jgi:hypothetical protein